MWHDHSASGKSPALIAHFLDLSSISSARSSPLQICFLLDAIFFLNDSALKDFGKRKAKWKNLSGRTHSSDTAAAAVEESQQQGSSLEEFAG